VAPGVRGGRGYPRVNRRVKTTHALRGRMVKYDDIAYFEALADALNQDAQFQSKASSLKTSLLFVKKDRPDGALLRIDGGKVSAENVPVETPAEFTFTAPYDVWVTNHRDSVPLEKLIMTGKVKLKGSIPKIMMMKNTLTLIDAKAKTIPAEY